MGHLPDEANCADDKNSQRQEEEENGDKDVRKAVAQFQQVDDAKGSAARRLVMVGHQWKERLMSQQWT